MAAELDLSDLREALAWWSGKRLFFVGGQGKSGTTWVEQALDAHPDISCRGEGHLFDGLAMRMDQAVSSYRKELDQNNKLFRELPGYPLPEPEDGVRTMRGLLLDTMRSAADGNARCIGERTPANIAHLDLLVRLFPDAAFVHVIRDVRDVAVSLWHHMRRVQPSYDRPLEVLAVELAANWSKSMSSVRRFGREQLGDAYLEVRYEDLFTDTATALAPVVRALGADDDAVIMARIAEASSFRTLSGREPGEVDPASHFRAGVAGGWREVLDEETAAEVWELAGGTLKRLGYER